MVSGAAGLLARLPAAKELTNIEIASSLRSSQ
jgi:hypothetical protein